MTRSGWHTPAGAVVIGNAGALRAHNNAVDARVREAQAALEADDLERAASLADALLTRVPGNPMANLIVGICAQRAGELERAAARFARVLRCAPDNVDASYGLAMVLNDLRRNDEALVAIERTLSLSPDDARHQFRAGLIYGAVKHAAGERAALERSVELDPKQSMSRNALANLLRERGELLAALEHYEAAAKAAPLEGSTYGNAAVSVQEMGDIAGSVRLVRQCLALEPFNRVFFSNLLLALNYAHDLPPRTLARLHQRYGELLAVARPPAQPGYWREQEPLRVGLVSPDLRRHPVSAFVEPLLEYGRAAGLDIFCYSDSLIVDEVTQRLRGHPVSWRDIGGLEDEAVARIVTCDALDVLLDLSGHTGQNRLTLFTRRLAPLQGTWLGYTFSTGVRDMDIRITDDACDPVSPPGGPPEDEPPADALYVESLLRLTPPFLCFRRPEVEPLAAPRAAGPPRFICLNNVAKMSPPMLEAWAEILRRLPDATLTLKSRLFAEPQMRSAMRTRLHAHGVQLERVTMDPTLESYEAHMRYYDGADIALDTFPYNGTTTTCEALWMGVPVVALRGQLHAGRVGASLLRSLGLEAELVAEDIAGYVKTAVTLARDLEGTRALRARIQAAVRDGALLDAPAFATRLKHALTTELRARQQQYTANARAVTATAGYAGPPVCIVAGMPRAARIWSFKVLRELLALQCEVQTTDLRDVLEPASRGPLAPAPSSGKPVVSLTMALAPDAGLAAMLASGEACAICTERPLDQVLASMVLSEKRVASEVLSLAVIEPVLDAREYWRAQPHVRRVDFEQVAAEPERVVRDLAHWLGLRVSAQQVEHIVAAAASVDAQGGIGQVRSSSGDAATGTRAHLGAAAAEQGRHTGMHTRYADLLGERVFERFTQIANARENARASLAAYAQATPSVPVRIGAATADEGVLGTDVWLQLAPDISQFSTYVALEQGDWFEDELRYMRTVLQPGMRVLDLGANHGSYALSAAQRVGMSGQVWAVEPSMEPAARMFRAALVPGAGQISILRTAVGAYDGVARLSAEEMSETRRICDADDGEQVRMARLDSLCNEVGVGDVDYLKLDVEGYEERVLEGAGAFLEANDPIVQLEVRDGGKVSLSAVSRLREVGFACYQLVPGPMALRPFRDDGDSFNLNLFCLRASRAQALHERGLLFDDDAELDALGRFSWDQMTGRWPFAEALSVRWRRQLSESGAHSGHVLEALGWYLEAHADGSSPALAHAALGRAARSLAAVVEQRPLQRLSLARVFTELGMRERAVAVLRPLAAALPEAPDAGREPFICPLDDYRLHRPGRDVALSAWTEALVRATCLRIAGISSYQMRKQAGQLLHGFAELRVVDPRSSRTGLLLGALGGQGAAAMPGTDVREWSSEILAQFSNLPAWPAL